LFDKEKPYTKFGLLIEYYLYIILIQILIILVSITGFCLMILNQNWGFLGIAGIIVLLAFNYRLLYNKKPVNISIENYNLDALRTIIYKHDFFIWKYALYLIGLYDKNEEEIYNVLVKYIENRNPKVRIISIYSLSNLKINKAYLFIDFLEREKNEKVIPWIIKAISKQNPDEYTIFDLINLKHRINSIKIEEEIDRLINQFSSIVYIQ